MKILIPDMRIFTKSSIVVVAAVFSVVALADIYALTVPKLPAPTFADTEVATNIHIKAWTETTRLFNVILEFDATPSNNVQVAFGTDDSADGNLSDERNHETHKTS